MIGEEVKFTCLKEKAEMANGGVSCKEFRIKGGVFQLGGRKLLGKELEGSPGTVESLLKDGTYVGVRSIHGQGQGNRVSENGNGGQKEFGSGEGGV